MSLRARSLPGLLAAAALSLLAVTGCRGSGEMAGASAAEGAVSKAPAPARPGQADTMASADGARRVVQGRPAPASAAGAWSPASVAALYPPDWPASFGFGRRARRSEIRAEEIDVMPDGTGLPPGKGTVPEGERIYALKCQACHGPGGKGGPYDRLVGRVRNDSFPFGERPDLVKTVGNYWPYATTLYDYVNRAMPFNAPGSLTPHEIYSLVAYILYLNRIVPENVVIDAEALPKIVMPAHGRFVPDDRRGGPVVR